MSSMRKYFFLCAAVIIAGAANDAMAKNVTKQNPPEHPASSDSPDTTIHLPKDLTDNSDPFNASTSSGASSGSRYFQQQQNFREQDPVREQSSEKDIQGFGGVF